MRQFPVFVSAGEDHVAAVMTAPDQQPDGLVVLLAGTGRHNAIGSTLSALLSERLAGRAWRRSGSTTQARVTARVSSRSGILQRSRRRRRRRGPCWKSRARRSTSTSFAEVGTCFGSRIALSLVEDRACLGAVCLAPPILDVGGLGRMGRRVRDRRLGAFIRSNAALRRVVLSPLRRLLGARKPAPRVFGAFAHLDHARWSSSTATGAARRTTSAVARGRASRPPLQGSRRSSRHGSSCECSPAGR